MSIKFIAFVIYVRMPNFIFLGVWGIIKDMEIFEEKRIDSFFLKKINFLYGYDNVEYFMYLHFRKNSNTSIWHSSHNYSLCARHLCKSSHKKYSHSIFLPKQLQSCPLLELLWYFPFNYVLKSILAPLFCCTPVHVANNEGLCNTVSEKLRVLLRKLVFRFNSHYLLWSEKSEPNVKQFG